MRSDQLLPSSSMTGESLQVLARLRFETRKQHERIEQVDALRRLFADDYELGEYRALLGQLYGFHKPLESCLFKALPRELLAGFGHRRRTSAIVSDLMALTTPAEAIEQWPVCEALPAIPTAASCLGVFYVLEGSTLCGTLISRHLEAHFGAAIAGSMRYYRGYGPRNGIEWRSFREVVSTYVARHPSSCDAIVSAASDTFAALEGWLAMTGANRVPELPTPLEPGLGRAPEQAAMSR